MLGPWWIAIVAALVLPFLLARRRKAPRPGPDSRDQMLQPTILADAAEMERKRSFSSEIGSTSHGISGTKHEVFLSFRGPDTRRTFTNVLYRALRDKGINVFIDEKDIEGGEEIGHAIFQAIDDSKICIPVFSKEYASSRWCLRELDHMMKRRKANKLEVMPIFHNVKPSDVKLESEVYKNALTLHEANCETKAVEGWKEALREVTEILGWDTESKGYGDLTRVIAQRVWTKLKVSSVHIVDHLVGTDESVNEVVDLLNVGSEDVRVIGICGVGGIGKTTLAQVVYDKLSTSFENCSFISKIRESDLLTVQKKLVCDIIGDVGDKLCTIEHGKNIIESRFCQKEVLIFLDDVNHKDQLMALIAKKEWFGSRSRIIVTTRDQRVFRYFQDQFEYCSIYEVKELDDLTALKLFSMHAFGRDSPPEAFLSLTKRVITRTGGLPLAIEVIGSYLRGESEGFWQCTLKKMDRYPRGELMENLMLSYKALDRPQQQIFLDIACLLDGENKSYANYMWADSEYYPEEGIEILLALSLVKIGQENQLQMHDHLKDLGRSIVFKENDRDPGKRSRVWDHNEAFDMIERKKGTEAVEAVNFQGEKVRDTDFTPEDFIKMPNIRFLKLPSWTISGDFQDLFSNLKWLSWNWSPNYVMQKRISEDWCPRDVQAKSATFCPKDLVVLDLTWSPIDENWGVLTQLKVATGLKVLNLSHCEMLKETPDLSAFSSLEILILSECGKLTKLPNSIGMLRCLVELDVSRTRIKELPNTIVNLKSLKVLKIERSDMQKLPKTIGMIEELEEIHGNYCEGLEMLPNDIVRLSFLKILHLIKTRVKNIPELPQSLVSLHLTSSAAQNFPEIFNLVNRPSLRDLHLVFGEGDNDIYVSADSPYDVSVGNSLRMKLPSSVISFGGWLRCTRELNLFKCKNLRQIQQFPSGLRKLSIIDCNRLEVVDLSNLENLLELILGNLESCDIQGLEALASLQRLQVCECKSFKFSGLERPKNLQHLFLRRCPSLQTLPNLSNFKNLWYIEIGGCSELVEIEGLEKLESLESLYVCGCSSLRSSPDLSHLKKLKNVIWNGVWGLQKA